MPEKMACSDQSSIDLVQVKTRPSLLNFLADSNVSVLIVANNAPSIGHIPANRQYLLRSNYKH